MLGSRCHYYGGILNWPCIQLVLTSSCPLTNNDDFTMALAEAVDRFPRAMMVSKANVLSQAHRNMFDLNLK